MEKDDENSPDWTLTTSDIKRLEELEAIILQLCRAAYSGKEIMGLGAILYALEGLLSEHEDPPFNVGFWYGIGDPYSGGDFVTFYMCSDFIQLGEFHREYDGNRSRDIAIFGQSGDFDEGGSLSIWQDKLNEFRESGEARVWCNIDHISI